MDLPGWFVASGCLFQTVWNEITGRGTAWLGVTSGRRVADR